MNQAFHLYRLQQIDTQIDQVVASLSEIEKLLSGDETVNTARHLLEDLSKLLQHDRQALKNIEFAVKEQQIKIAQVESTLYGGKVRNPKELQDLQKDIASLKKHLAVLEDKQLEVMMAVEEKENQVKQADNQLSLAQAALSEKSSGWLGQKDHFLRLLDRLKAERTTAAPPIAPDSIEIYEKIRKRKSGIAVTSALDGSCTVCGASIRPMELQAARTAQDLVYCTSCGRILYVG
jgi:predicted  nucleic acid-binding Zn-ribbon protein